MTTALLLVLGLAIWGNALLAAVLVVTRRRRPAVAWTVAAVVAVFFWAPPVDLWAIFYTPYALWQRRRTATGSAIPSDLAPVLGSSPRTA